MVLHQMAPSSFSLERERRVFSTPDHGIAGECRDGTSPSESHRQEDSTGCEQEARKFMVLEADNFSRKWQLKSHHDAQIL